MVTTIMTGDGWAKGADGIWAKDGQKAALELKTTTGNKRRQLTAQILQSQWQQAGFQLTVTPEKAGVLFGQDLPGGNFQLGLYAQNPSDNDPGQCLLWCSQNIPGAVERQQRPELRPDQQWTLDKTWSDVDSNLDRECPDRPCPRRARPPCRIWSRPCPSIPFPDIIIINTDKIGVAGGGTFQHNFAYGPFTYMNTWYAK